MRGRERGEEDQDEFQSHSMVGFPRDEMRPRPPLSLICGSFSSSVHLPSRFRCSRRNRTTTAIHANNFPRNSRAHAGERRDGNGNLYCILRANHRAGSLQNAFASAEGDSDRCTKSRFYDVFGGACTSFAEAAASLIVVSRWSAEFGLELVEWPTDEAPKTGARSSLVPSVPACFARPPILPSPS